MINDTHITLPFSSMGEYVLCYDDVMAWEHFPQHWPFLSRILRWLIDPFHKGSVIQSFVSLKRLLNNKSNADDLKSGDAFLTSLCSSKMNTLSLSRPPPLQRTYETCINRSILWILSITYILASRLWVIEKSRCRYLIGLCEFPDVILSLVVLTMFYRALPQWMSTSKTITTSSNIWSLAKQVTF